MSENATPNAMEAPAGAETTPNPTPAPEQAAPEPRTREEILAAMDAAASQPVDDADTEPGTVEPEGDPELVPGEEVPVDEPGEPAAPEDDPSTAPAPEGLDHLDDRERQVLDLVTKSGLTLSQAQRQVYGEPETQPEPEPEPTADRVKEVDENIVRLEAEIDSLEGQDVDEFDTEARRKVNRALREKLLEIAELKAERKLALREQEQAAKSREQKAAEQQQAQLEGAWTEVGKQYPDAFVNGSELATACAEEIQYLQAANSPLLNDPRYPLLVARRVARAIGYRKPAEAPSAPAAPAATPSLQPTPPSAPVRGVRPVPAGGTPVEPKSAEMMIAEAEAAGKDALLDLMKQAGTPFPG